jgi:hypothetical protein
MHRIIYQHLVGPVPEGQQLDHICRVRCCVNPAHLEPVTQRENIVRGIGPTAVNAKKMFCPKGHEYIPRARKNGWRMCQICERDYKRQWQRDNGGKGVDPKNPPRLPNGKFAHANAALDALAKSGVKI